MIIAEQCQPGNYKNRNNWIPKCEWPEDCYVQWGDNGVVFTKDSYYNTAFFEVFPTDPKTFIRGEGKDIEEAEKDAYSYLMKYNACSEHNFERHGDINGICKHCGLFKSNIFK